jgi:hypothetical protein
MQASDNAQISRGGRRRRRRNKPYQNNGDNTTRPTSQQGQKLSNESTTMTSNIPAESGPNHSTPASTITSMSTSPTSMSSSNSHSIPNSKSRETPTSSSSGPDYRPSSSISSNSNSNGRKSGRDDGRHLSTSEWRHKVVHCRKSNNYDVYVGRRNPTIPESKLAPGGGGGFKWGNPFKMENESQRMDVVRQFRHYLLSRPDLVQMARRELKGKTLACWCSPLACHGDVLAEVANGEPAAIIAMRDQLDIPWPPDTHIQW